MNKNKKEHNYGIDMLRITAMLMIVAHHFSLHSGISFDAGSVNGIVMQVMALSGKIGVNVFVLITGYYSVGKIRREKIMSLIGSTTFYSLVLTMLAAVLGSVAFSKKLLVKAVFPWLLGGNYWFVVTYIELYLLTPLLNKVIEELEIRTFEKYLGLFTYLLCIVPTVLGRFIEVNDFGYNALVWFVYLYFLGAYLNKRSECRNVGQYISIAACLAFVQIAACIVLQKDLVSGILSLVLKCVSDYSANGVFPLAIAVSLFLAFQNLEIRFGRKLIQKVGAATLGVYLFHDNVHFRGWLWQNIYQLIEAVGRWPFAVNAVLSVSAVFVLGSVIELLRASIVKSLRGAVRKNMLRE